MAKISIIGGGIAGITAASVLASNGYDVAIFEKNNNIGGRINTLEIDGFKFDMGPSWYWMPDVFERFYNKMGFSTKDFYDLKKLDPGFRVVFADNQIIDISSDVENIFSTFDKIEKNSGEKLKNFLIEASEKYDLSMKKFVYNPSFSWLEYCSIDLFKSLFKHSLVRSYAAYVAQNFKNPNLRMLLEFPVLFLGAKPNQIPSLYSIMSHSAFTQGTFYPMGGMNKIAEAFKNIAIKKGVVLHTNNPVHSLNIQNGVIKSVENRDTDFAICAMDYNHFEQNILPREDRTYSKKYWDTRVMSPSALIFFIGLNKRTNNLAHHTLFFDADFKLHSEEIYDEPKWPTNPLFYVSATSQTDPNVAPSGCENLFILMPLAPGIEDNDTIRESYFVKIWERIKKIEPDITLDDILVKKSYCIKNFEQDYNSYKGNAYGLANTLRQTGVFKPSMRSKKISNLYYTGQLTVPGPGLPPAIISGEIVADLINKKNCSI